MAVRNRDGFFIRTRHGGHPRFTPSPPSLIAHLARVELDLMLLIIWNSIALLGAHAAFTAPHGQL